MFRFGQAACAAVLWVPGVVWAQDAELGLWNAFLAVGDGTSEEVLARTDAARDSLMAGAMDFRVDAGSVELMTSVRSEALQLDLKSLYERLPEVADEGRLLRMHGLPVTESHYEWTLYPECDAEGHGALLGLDSRTQMVPVDQALSKGNGFAVNNDMVLGTGPWTHTDVAALFQAALLALEDAAKRPVSERERQRVVSEHPGLEAGVGAPLYLAAEKMAPRLVRSISSVMTVDRVGNLRDGEVLELDLLARIRTKGLSDTGARALSKYLSRLDDLLVLEMSVRDSNGLPVGSLGVSTETLGVRIGVSSRGGALIPRRSGKAATDLPLYPTDRSMDFTLRTDVQIRAEGMLLKISDFEVPLTYRSQAGLADMGAVITEEPTLEFTGQGTLTRWVAEVVDSALNLEAHGQVVFKAMAEGTDGTGSRMAVRYADESGMGSVHSSAKLLLVDNALVKMGMRIVGRQLAPSDEVVGDGIGLLQDWVRAVDADYQAIRPQLELGGA